MFKEMFVTLGTIFTAAVVVCFSIPVILLLFVRWLQLLDKVF